MPERSVTGGISDLPWGGLGFPLQADEYEDIAAILGVDILNGQCVTDKQRQQIGQALEVAREHQVDLSVPLELMTRCDP